MNNRLEIGIRLLTVAKTLILKFRLPFDSVFAVRLDSSRSHSILGLIQLGGVHGERTAFSPGGPVGYASARRPSGRGPKHDP